MLSHAAITDRMKDANARRIHLREKLEHLAREHAQTRMDLHTAEAHYGLAIDLLTESAKAEAASAEADKAEANAATKTEATSEPGPQSPAA